MPSPLIPPPALSVPIDQVTLRRVVGDPLLEYLLATGPVRLGRHFGGLKHSLSPSQEDVIEDCADLVDKIEDLGALDDGDVCLLFLSRLATRDAAGYTLAEAFRLKAGGRPAGIAERDPVLGLLLRIGVDAYPLIIGRESGLGPRFQGSPIARPFVAAVQSNPVRADLVRALKSDPDFGAPGVGAALFHWRSASTNLSGDFFRVEPESLPLALLNGAVSRFVTDGASPSLRGFMHAIRVTLTDARRALRGQRIPLRYCIAFSGMTLTRPAVVRTPWGDLFPPPEPVARSFRPFGVDPDLLFVGTTAAVATRAPAPLPDVILPSEDQSAGNLIPLAALLASKDTDLAVPVIEWAAPLSPFGGLQSWWSPLRVISQWQRPSPPVAPTELRRWAYLLAKRFDPSLETARSRALRAVAERIHQEDALVDAVTAWENIIGSASETLFRVTGAAACMLEPLAEARGARVKRLRRIYDLRSRIVHGTPREKDPKLWADLHSLSGEAVLTAVHLLRSLFESFPDLIPLKSSLRAEALLLGAALRSRSEVT